VLNCSNEKEEEICDAHDIFII